MIVETESNVYYSAPTKVGHGEEKGSSSIHVHMRILALAVSPLVKLYTYKVQYYLKYLMTYKSPKPESIDLLRN